MLSEALINVLSQYHELYGNSSLILFLYFFLFETAHFQRFRILSLMDLKKNSRGRFSIFSNTSKYSVLYTDLGGSSLFLIFFF